MLGDFYCEHIKEFNVVLAKACVHGWYQTASILIAWLGLLQPPRIVWLYMSVLIYMPLFLYRCFSVHVLVIT